MRKNSPTFGKYVSEILSNQNRKSLFIPEGFAHGFKTLADDTLFCYDCTDVYNREAEGSIIWNDPEIGIDRNIENPVVSEKDAQAPLFRDFESQF